jgi:deoxyribonuclease-4
MLRIGAHDREGDPLTVVHATGADVIQFFLGDPQGWDAPTFPGGDAAALREALAAAGVDVYIHAPYGINVASANNRLRIPSRKLLAQQLEAAAEVGAKGLVVHGGYVTGGVADDVGYDNWRKAMERIPRPIPLLIENTAGGDNAMTRYLDRIGRLWDAISVAEGFDMIGFCLDTCHAHAGGNDLATVVEDVVKITGKVDLVHANDSRDEFDSGADRHTNFGQGHIDPDALAGVVRAANAPVVCETPGGAEEHRADFEFLRSRL